LGSKHSRLPRSSGRSIVHSRTGATTHAARFLEDSTAVPKEGTFLLGSEEGDANRINANLPVVLFSAIQIAIILSIMWLWRPMAPFRDEWFTVPIVSGFNSGALGWEQLWALHNEHRIVLPRLFDLFLIEVTGWNRQVEDTIDLALGIATAVLLLKAARGSVRGFPSTRVAGACLALLIFSLSQYETWLSPFQVAFLGTAFGVTCCVWSLAQEKRSAASVAVMVAGALIASFSSIAGLLTWYVFLPSVALRWRYWMITWVAVALAVTVPYFIGFRTISSSRGTPTLIAEFTMTYIGSPLLGIPSGAGLAWPALICGIAGIAIMALNVVVLCRHRYRLQALLLWLEVAAFALGCAVITAVGRVGSFGVFEAMDSRYQSFSMLWWVSVLVIIGLTTRALKEAPSRVSLLKSALVRVNRVVPPSMLVALVIANSLGLIAGVLYQRDQLRHQGCIVHYRTASEACMTYFVANPTLVRTGSAYLERHHLATFRQSRW
jgi:hypothetical protein